MALFSIYLVGNFVFTRSASIRRRLFSEATKKICEKVENLSNVYSILWKFIKLLNFQREKLNKTGALLFIIKNMKKNISMRYFFSKSCCLVINRTYLEIKPSR